MFTFTDAFPGCTVVYPYDSQDYTPAELGASIFVSANKNMMRAAKEFNLTLLKFDDDDEETGVWSGEEFFIKVSSCVELAINMLTSTDRGKLVVELDTQHQSYLAVWVWSPKTHSKAVIIFPCLSPPLTTHRVEEMVDSYLNLYSKDTPRWNNVREVVDTLQFTTAVNQTGAEYFDTHDVDPRWTRELIEAATRVNYAQVHSQHALWISSYECRT